MFVSSSFRGLKILVEGEAEQYILTRSYIALLRIIITVNDLCFGNLFSRELKIKGKFYFAYFEIFSSFFEVYKLCIEFI